MGRGAAGRDGAGRAGRGAAGRDGAGQVTRGARKRVISVVWLCEVGRGVRVCRGPISPAWSQDPARLPLGHALTFFATGTNPLIFSGVMSLHIFALWTLLKMRTRSSLPMRTVTCG